MPPRNSRAKTNGADVAWFLERFCCHVEGEKMGQPLAVEPWQQLLLDEMFRLEADGRRYWRRVTIGIPRGNGKSTLISGLGHYLLVADNENAPEIYSGAAGTTQARVVHDAARVMGEMSPRLRRHVIIQRDAIYHPASRGVWRVVSRIGDLQQGTKPHAALIDEYHVHTTDALYQAFRTGMHKRTNPLLAAITTAGIYGRGPLWTQYRSAMKHGDVEQVTPFLRISRDHDSRLLVIWWGLPEDSEHDISDPVVVRGCNPASFVDVDRIIREGLGGDLREADFRRYYCNQWVTTVGEGIPPSVWDDCQDDELELVDGATITVGVDIGWKHDWSAVVAAGRVGDRVVVRCWAFKPPDGEDLDIRSTVGQVVEELTQRFHVSAIGVDPFAAVSLIQDWTDRGWPVISFPQTNPRMCPASADLLRMVQTRALAHDGDPVLREHCLNAVMKDTSDSRAWRFVKPQTQGGGQDDDAKIDALVALLMSVFLLHGDDGISSYETMDLVVL